MNPHPQPRPVPPDDPREDDFVVHVERVLGPAKPPRAADRPPSPGPPAPGAPPDRRLLRCDTCSWTIECLVEDEARYARAG